MRIDLDVRDRAQLAEQPRELAVREHERVAAGQQHVADGGRARRCRRGLAQVVLAHHEVRVADHALAEAVAAVDGALGRDAEGHLVRVVVDEVLDRAVADLVERVRDADDVGRGLVGERDDLPADGAGRVERVHQARVVRRDGPAEDALGRGDAGALLGRRLDVAGERAGVVDAVAHLPAPVGPLGEARVVLREGGHGSGWAAGRRTRKTPPDRAAVLSARAETRAIRGATVRPHLPADRPWEAELSGRLLFSPARIGEGIYVSAAGRISAIRPRPGRRTGSGGTRGGRPGRASSRRPRRSPST